MAKGKREYDEMRPSCGTCGAPAVSEINLDVRDLNPELQGRQVYWVPDFRQAQTRISMMSCKACVGKHVKVSTAVDISVVKK